MRKLIAATTIAASLAALAVPAVSMAGTGTAGNGQTSKMTGKNTITYVDGTWGNVASASEVQHPQFDNVTLHLTVPWVAQEGQSNLTIGWNSDFGGRPTGTLTYNVSPDGMTITGIATYPAS